LGNVRAVVSDVKREFQGSLFSTLRSTAHYYPFGMLQPGRNFTSVAEGYRYGYNGKEEDEEGLDAVRLQKGLGKEFSQDDVELARDVYKRSR
jgi:hypothetical protein